MDMKNGKRGYVHSVVFNRDAAQAKVLPYTVELLSSPPSPRLRQSPAICSTYLSASFSKIKTSISFQ
jgi:hypothetical protein